ncbi:hypothetical protein AruPA_17865 [Acidiphilium sp. PA]|uniref:hypothetical protein n=1 Tax=Acidiphilium sp. PA TaxID=2871705 RepID=UPI002243D9A5|nr:hypothetical protein [Acidiphilium sp. PA]MCW8308903.1 hypothetical protein [Acidiphilium sp. PA]
MHYPTVMVLHAIVYGVVFQLLRDLTEPDLVGLGVTCLAGLFLFGRTPIMRRRYRGQYW